MRLASLVVLGCNGLSCAWGAEHETFHILWVMRLVLGAWIIESTYKDAKSDIVDVESGGKQTKT